MLTVVDQVPEKADPVTVVLDDIVTTEVEVYLPVAVLPDSVTETVSL